MENDDSKVGVLFWIIEFNINIIDIKPDYH